MIPGAPLGLLAGAPDLDFRTLLFPHLILILADPRFLWPASSAELARIPAPYFFPHHIFRTLFSRAACIGASGAAEDWGSWGGGRIASEAGAAAEGSLLGRLGRQKIVISFWVCPVGERKAAWMKGRQRA